MGIIIQILITMAFSAFFSGMEIAFVSSNKLRFEMDRNSQSINSRILSIFFHNPNNFISTMLVGNNIALVIYGILMAQVIEQNLLAGLIDNHFLLVLIQTIISTLIILVTGEFLPKTLFKINPNFTLNIFAVPTYICYVLLYPISKFASGISNILLYIIGIKTNKEANEKAFTKVDLDYFIQSSIQDVQNEQDIDTEVKIFQNALDFSNIRIRDCMVPRTEIVAIEYGTPIEELKARFIESGISKIIVYKENIDNIILQLAFSPSPPSRIRKTSAGGIETDPTSRLPAKSNKITTPNPIPYFQPLLIVTLFSTQRHGGTEFSITFTKVPYLCVHHSFSLQK